MNTTHPTIGAAVRALAGVCDGASSRDTTGYNGADANFGHRLAAKPDHLWTTRDRREAWERIAKYRVQLGHYGIDYDEIPEPVDPATVSVMVARFGGRCPNCGLPWKPGTEIAWDAATRQRSHIECPFVLTPERAPAAQPGAFHPVVAPAAFPAHQAPSRVAAMLPPEMLAQALGSVGILGPSGAIAAKLPGYEAREAQLRMAQLVDQAIAERTHVVIEAGTGTGKSLGYLVPAILSGKKTVVSTADKALQEQIWLKDVPFLQSVMPRPFRAALLKGRSNYLCRAKFDRLQDDLSQESMFESGQFRTPQAAELWPEVAEWAGTTETGDVSSFDVQLPGDLLEMITTDAEGCTGQRCPAYKTCFAERAKDEASKADVTIVNHALLLRDLKVREQTEGFASILPSIELVVLDEAHHLEEIATDALGLEITAGQWVRVEHQVQRLTSEALAKGAAKAAREGDEAAAETMNERAKTWELRIQATGSAVVALLDHFATRCTEQGKLSESNQTTLLLGDERTTFAPAITAMKDLEGSMREFAPEFERPEDQANWEKLVERLEALGVGMGRMAAPGEVPDEVVRYAELANNGRAKLCLKHVDVAPELQRLLWNACLVRRKRKDGEAEDDTYDVRAHNLQPVTVVSCSATITSSDGFGPWRGRVGLADAMELSVGSPFDYQRNALLYLPKDAEGLDPSRFYRDGSEDYYNRLADQYEQLILASDGRAFCLFTSFRVLNAVYERLSPRLAKYLVLKQGDLPRPEMVRRFKEDGHAVLFGVKSFWEGVDVQGEALSLVVIDKLPFVPPGDPVYDARKRVINRRAGDSMAWFRAMAVYDATLALKQGFGRLVRTRQDRGVVALLDGRLTTKRYGSEILRSLPPATGTRSLEAVRGFFGAPSGRGA